MRALKRMLLVLSWSVILPASAYAQATLSGVVKDTSGAGLTFWGGLGEAEVATNRPNLGYPDPTCTFGRGLSF